MPDPMSLEELALSFDPFEGDRDVNVASLSDKFVTGRKVYECHTCAGPIAKGERHRAKTERDDDEGRIGTFRFCALCCAAMASDDDDAYERRHVLGTARRDPKTYAQWAKVPGLRLPPELEAEAVSSQARDTSDQRGSEHG